MTRNDVILALMRTGLYRGAWDLDDDTYDAFSEAFAAQAWSAWAESLPPELKQMADIGGGKTVARPKWLPESFDCDNLARDFGVFVSRCMAVDAVKSGRARGNAACGKLNFKRGGVTPHAVNWFVNHDGIARIIDVEDGIVRNLTQAELLTVECGESC